MQKELVKTILDSVRTEPKTIQELAFLLQKNWRTADRYVEQIAVETGLISSKIFRKGSRGALKLVYWNALEPGKGSAYQERLLQKLLQGRHKEDFSPFDIFQFVSQEQRDILRSNKMVNYTNVLATATEQILFFSGNLSWIDESPESMKLFESLLKKGIRCNILTRIDIVSEEKTHTLLQLNTRFGADLIHIRHCEQPLRAMIIDSTNVSLKETLSPRHHKELPENVFLYYSIKDKEWILWLQRVFWQLWNQSVDAETRLKALKEIHH